MKKLFLFATLVLTILSARSQELTKETWEEKPVLHKLEGKLNDESAVLILDKRRVEYIDEKDDIAVYRTLHRIIHINDDKGIEAFNKVYLPVSSNSEIVDIHARTILPNGKIIEVSKENIKDLKDEDDQVYKIFAMEGLEKGAEVEFFYTYKRNTSFFGTETIQGRSPIIKAQIEVVAPKRLIFEMKGFNSDVKPADEISGEKRWMRVEEKDIPATEKEKYSADDANLRRFEFKLAYNTSRATKDRLLTWDELAKRVYRNYTTVSDKEMKRVNDLIDDMKVRKLSTTIEKIVAVEDYLKTNFAAREDIDGEDAANLEKVIKSKLASHLGIVRLYAAIFRELGVEHEFALATDRTENTIEKNFENWNNCDNPVIYFPTLKKYLAPTLPEYRYPWIEPGWGNANAFFCRSTTIGNFTTAYGEVRNIPLEDYSKTVSNTDATIELNKTADTLIVNISQIYSGYAAAPYRAIFTFSSDENKKEMTKEMIKFGTKSENVVSSKMENVGFENYQENKPFILNATVKASELVEKAGNKTIIKIGDIIGPQAEMYQEKPRQTPISVEFPHVLERNIVFTIPQGYTIKNADDLKIKHVFSDGGQVTMGFESDYKIEGDKLIVHIMEEYRKTYYPLSQFEDFKTVINAAADFNKIVLVLEKK